MSRENRGKDMCDSSDSDSESDSDESSKQNQNKSLRKKLSGAAKYNTKYNPSWAKTYPVKDVPNDRHSGFCIPCGKKIRCGHPGLTDKRNVTEANKNNISRFFTNSNETSKAVTKAEVMVTNFLVQHNLPLATADHMGPLFKAIFPDSKIASSYMPQDVQKHLL